MPEREILVEPSFLNEVLGLPKAIQKRLDGKLKLLRSDPVRADGAVEKIKGTDKDLFRIHVGEDYRLIYQYGTGWVKLLRVGNRKEVYERIPDRFSVPNAASLPSPAPPAPLRKPGRVCSSEFSPSADQRAAAPAPEEPLPVELTASILEKWRVPSKFSGAILALRTVNDLYAAELPYDVFSVLVDHLAPKPIEALGSGPELVLQEPEDLEKFIEGDLVGFLLKLDPDQQALVKAGAAGPVLVKGGPGTGKSTVALYRAQALVKEGVTPILFTTFTTALVAYSEQLLEFLLQKPLKTCGVRVCTIDSLARELYVPGNGQPRMPPQRDALKAVSAALSRVSIPAADAPARESLKKALERLDKAYLLAEFEGVIEAAGLTGRDEYRAIERRGRAVPFRQPLRDAVWATYEEWRKELVVRSHFCTWGQMRMKALDVARSTKKGKFGAVLVDEAQDLSPTSLRFAVAMAENPRSIYLTADASQSLYQRGFAWKDIHEDLRVAGRTRLLKKNYRNTPQIAAACRSILEGTTAGDSECLVQESVVAPGEPPTVLLTDAPAAELRGIQQFLLAAAKRYRLPVHGTVILSPSNEAAQKLATDLGQYGIKAKAMGKRELDLREPVVKVMTYHSAKGLEFPFVVATGLTEGELPRHDPALPAEERENHFNEQRRLFYVGCSRAMRALMVCGLKSNPSRFLSTLTPPLWKVVVT